MPTEQDLRSSLSALADLAPTQVDISAVAAHRGPQHRSRSRFAAPVIAAAVVVAVAGALTLVADRRSGHGGLAQPGNFRAPTTLPTNAYIFDLDTVPGYVAHDRGVSPAQQWMAYTNAEGIDAATVSLFPAGGYTPQRPAGAQSVEINGSVGFYGTVGAQPSVNQKERGTLVWEYAPGAWASVTYFGPGPDPRTPNVPDPTLTKDEAIRFAEAVRPGASHDARFPVALTALPANATTDVQAVSIENNQSGLFVGPPTSGSYFSANTLHVQVFAPGAVTGDVGNTGFGYQPVSFGDFHGAYYADEDRIDVTNGQVQVNVGTGVPHGVFSLADLERTVEGMSFATSLTDQLTWFPVSAVLPR